MYLAQRCLHECANLLLNILTEHSDVDPYFMSVTDNWIQPFVSTIPTVVQPITIILQTVIKNVKSKLTDALLKPFVSLCHNDNKDAYISLCCLM